MMPWISDPLHLALLAPPRQSRRRRCARAPLIDDAADQRSAASCSRCRLRRYRCSRRRRLRARHHSRRRAHPRGGGRGGGVLVRTCTLAASHVIAHADAVAAHVARAFACRAPLLALSRRAPFLALLIDSARPRPRSLTCGECHPNRPPSFAANHARTALAVKQPQIEQTIGNVPMREKLSRTVACRLLQAT